MWYTDILGYLVTMDVVKAFDFLDHDFLLSVFKKFGFGKNFIHWIKVLLNDQQSSIYKWRIYNSMF